MKTFKQHLKEASMWDYIYKKNNGVFYRCVGRSGNGTGIGGSLGGGGVFACLVCDGIGKLMNQQDAQFPDIVDGTEDVESVKL